MERKRTSAKEASNVRHQLADEFAAAARLYAEGVAKLVQNRHWPYHQSLRGEVLEAQRKAEQAGEKYQEFLAALNKDATS